MRRAQEVKLCRGHCLVFVFGRTSMCCEVFVNEIFIFLK